MWHTSRTQSPTEKIAGWTLIHNDSAFQLIILMISEEILSSNLTLAEFKEQDEPFERIISLDEKMDLLG